MTERMKQMFPEELQEMLQVVCPETYRKKLFLTQADIQSILEISRTKSYEILRNAPFRVEKIGAQIRVPAFDFWLWYLGSGSLNVRGERSLSEDRSGAETEAS